MVDLIITIGCFNYCLFLNVLYAVNFILIFICNMYLGGKVGREVTFVKCIENPTKFLIGFTVAFGHKSIAELYCF